MTDAKKRTWDVLASIPEALPAIFYSDVWVTSESNLICLSQICVKKETKKARIYDISHFATKVRRCSESNLICLSQIWVKRRPKNYLSSIVAYLLTYTLRNECEDVVFVEMLIFGLNLIHFPKWLRLSAKSLLSKTEKNSDIWADSDNLCSWF